MLDKESNWSDFEQLLTQEYHPHRRSLSHPNYVGQFRGRSFEREDISTLFHENTKTDKIVQDRTAASQAEMTDGMIAIEQDYRTHECVTLPDEMEVNADFANVLASRRSVREFAERSVTRMEIATLLAHACGNTGSMDVNGQRKPLRAYPSAGALYPVEPYIMVLDGDDIDAGLYYYSVTEHCLRALSVKDGDFSRTVNEAYIDEQGPVDDISNTPVVFALTGAFWRQKLKYGPRGYRYTLQESGHVAQNILLTATAIGMGGVPLANFHDRRMNDLLNVDGTEEAVLYSIAVGHITPRTND